MMSMVCTRIPLLGLAAAGLMLIASPSRADEHANVERLFGAGQLTEAVQAADEFLASSPRDARMRFLKGLVVSEQGRPAEAIAVFVKLTEDFPELPEPHNNLAVLYSKQGQYEQARRSLEAAIRSNPSYTTAYENLGDVHAKLASQAYSKALQIDGDSSGKLSLKLALIRDMFSLKAASAKPAAPLVVAAAPKPAAAATAVAAARTSSPVIPTGAATPVNVQEVQAAVKAWASAWSRKDINGYFAAYTPEYAAGKSRNAWEADRRTGILSKRSISVVLSDFETRAHGDKAVVRFRQSYTADALTVQSRTTLEMVNVAGRWLIQKESTDS